jgi:hypothetical protein
MVDTYLGFMLVQALGMKFPFLDRKEQSGQLQLVPGSIPSSPKAMGKVKTEPR